MPAIREEYKMKIAMTGVSGNMGREALRQVLELGVVEFVRVLLTPKKKNDKLARRLSAQYGSRLQIVRGWLSDASVCEKLVEGTDIVVNMAAVIPPHSDKNPQASYLCNQLGAMRLTDAVAAMPDQAKLIHTSSVAVYGSRTLDHPWGRPGDPLLPSVYDFYAMHKMIAERYVMESPVKSWAVLRQTAMLYDGIIFSNISDGLLFHTTLNGPLEWVTAHDSGYLIKRIVEREAEGANESFWPGVYDISGGAANRRTGFDTFKDGFAVMGGSPKSYFRPDWCATRNFHGLWYADNTLEDMFGYQRETVEQFWQAMGKKYKIFKMARMLPPALIKLAVFKRLLGDSNAPSRWLKDGDVAKVTAAFGSVEQAKALPKKWEDFTVESAEEHGSAEKYPKSNLRGKMLCHGYDEEKPMEEWDLKDMQGAAVFRGGKCLSAEMAPTPLSKLLWQCSEGHTFSASPFTVLKGGHWCPFCQPQPWIYDKLAKKSPYIAQVWYDSHSPSENYSYSFDKEGAAHMEDMSEEDK